MTQKQTEAQRLADELNKELPMVPGAQTGYRIAALLLRQDELLKQALEKFELIAAGEDYGKIDGLITAIRALREAK